MLLPLLMLEYRLLVIGNNLYVIIYVRNHGYDAQHPKPEHSIDTNLMKYYTENYEEYYVQYHLKGYADGVSDGSLGMPDLKKFEKGEELNER